jgi:hypothetical protein
MDADFQHRPEDIYEISRHIDNYDMVIGARTAESHFPLFRKPGKFLISRFASYVAGFKIKDINSGIRIFKKNEFMRFIDILPNGFSLTTTITLLYIKSGYSLLYVPITVMKRKGKSSVGITDGLRTMLLILRTLLLFGPLKFFLPLSLFVFFTGVGELVYEFYIHQYLHFSTSSLLLFISSLLIFLFGLISEQINELKRVQ